MFGGGDGGGGGGGGASSSAEAAGAGGKVVKCLACGMYAHRRCAFRNYAVHCALMARSKSMVGGDVCCSVNGPLIKKLDVQLGIADEEDDSEEEAVVVSSCTSDSNRLEEDDEEDLIEMDTVHGKAGDEDTCCNDADDSKSVIEADEIPPIPTSEDALTNNTSAAAPSFLSRIGWGSQQVSAIDDKSDAMEEAIIVEGKVESVEEATNTSIDDNSANSDDDNESDGDGDDGDDAIWTEDGPPSHWAADEQAENKLCGSTQSNEKEKEDSDINDDRDGTGDADAPIVPSAQPFSSVARALHESVLPLFLGKQEASDEEGSYSDREVPSKEQPKVEESSANKNEADMAVSEPPCDSDVIANILPELDPKAPPSPPPPPPSTFATAVEVVRTTRRTRSNMGVASVAGSIVGGVAGLALAGPAGAIMLSKVCQTAGVLSVLLDGTMSIGVLVAGAAAAKFAAEQVAQGGSRMLALGGGKEGSRAVMLVRPNVIVDPVWGELTDAAKRSHPKVLATTKRTLSGAGFLANHQAKVADQAKIRRNEVDADIVNSDEYEIATPDKVVLIVSRSLNDRLSLPGHVYNKLIHEYRRRAEERKVEKAAKISSDEKITETKLIDNNDAAGNNDDGARFCDGENEEESNFCRARRQDAHGVIKHVTATLLEVRPGLGATSSLTELTASSVESLVFGELYDSVFEEICEETAQKDDALMTKMYEFESDHQARRKARMEELSDSRGWATDVDDEDEFVDCVEFPIADENISVDALEALLSMSDAKSSVDKLEFCVKFLEAISVHFDQAAGGGKSVSADYLLKMVCEHIIVAKVPRLNAELAFLEEFARDEQLLRGKEGYSLVTLQASLHFLNASKDFDADIFKDGY